MARQSIGVVDWGNGVTANKLVSTQMEALEDEWGEWYSMYLSKASYTTE